ncbi:TerC family protein [Alkalibacillus haloalkaliphilus]|uniref:TerC family protein n=1 Tax=Alkalibacillus haloalkaliphilus TaxID=94136 RepID=UPI0002E75512|nr:TerC family protein [Alkalibacillus haloalkaliphilus]
MEILFDINWDILKAVLIIIGIDLILGGDNAVVIAMASRNLPKSLQNKAIILGTTFAILFRFLLATIAIYLLTIPYVQLVGGVFLFFIAIQLLLDKGDSHQNISASATMFGAVKTIIIADVVMGFDNVLAISAASNQNLYLIMFGLLVSVPIIIFGSKLILHFMSKYPIIIYFGAALLAYTSAELILKEIKLQPILIHMPLVHWIFPIAVILITVLIGYLSRKKAAY